MRTYLKTVAFTLILLAGFGYLLGAGAHIEQPALQPKARRSAFCWDGIKDKQKEPTWHRFAGEFPAGMLRRLEELPLDN